MIETLTWTLQQYNELGLSTLWLFVGMAILSASIILILDIILHALSYWTAEPLTHPTQYPRPCPEGHRCISNNPCPTTCPFMPLERQPNSGAVQTPPKSSNGENTMKTISKYASVLTAAIIALSTGLAKADAFTLNGTGLDPNVVATNVTTQMGGYVPMIITIVVGLSVLVWVVHLVLRRGSSVAR